MKNLLILCALFGGLSSCIGHESQYARSLAVQQFADVVLLDGKIITVDKEFSIKEAVAIKGGKFAAAGSDGEMRVWTGPKTRVIRLDGRTVIPGLIDSHIHATVAGLRWDAELHWERTKSLAEGLKQIAAAAKAKPAGSWIVVAGGWVPTQFVERRFPTKADLDVVAPDHPVYVQYLRQGALVNEAGLAAAGVSHNTPDPAGGKFERNPATGKLTGLVQGAPAWRFIYDKIPRPALDRIRESLRSCFRELSRFGVTSIGDMHTSGVNFAHRRVLADMARAGELAVRIKYYIAPNEPGDELEQLRRGAAEVKELPRNDMFGFAGFAETLVRGTGDGDGLSNPQGITINAEAKEKYRKMLSYFAQAGHNFHLHATQNHTARQLLDVVEAVNKDVPFKGQRIAFAHLEDATPDTIERIKKLGGGIAVQDRLVLTAERNYQIWGATKARNAPPLRTMIKAGVPMGAGTDAFRSGNFSPMLSLWWLVTGKTVAGTQIRDPSQNLTRAEALRAYTNGSAWFTFDENRKGSIEVGKLADLTVLNADYLTVPQDRVPSLESVLTMVGGRVVYASGPYAQLEHR